jgi:Flp pilus assembly protein TadG
MNINDYQLFVNTPQRFEVAQRGAILPLAAIGMMALLGMAGLALDMGHAYLNRTRLQNALDAAALSGAKTLNELGNTAAAETAAASDAVIMFRNNADANGNELSAVENASVNVQFSPTVDPFNPVGANPRRFIRVSVADGNFSWPTSFIRVLSMLGANFDTLQVSGSAVAGPMSVCPDDITPMVACTNDLNAGSPPDFGYVVGDTYNLKVGAPNNQEGIGPGNFKLLSIPSCGTGANCVRDNLAGGFSSPLCSGTGAEVMLTQPGNLAGPVKQGLNSRLDCPPSGNCGGGLDTTLYPPDIYTNYPIGYSQYQTDVASPSFVANPRGRADRRILKVPFANCTGMLNGRSEITILGVGCFFMKEPVTQGGNAQEVNSEYVRSCPASGGTLGNSAGMTGPWSIILYKDFTPGVADS